MNYGKDNNIPDSDSCNINIEEIDSKKEITIWINCSYIGKLKIEFYNILGNLVNVAFAEKQSNYFQYQLNFESAEQIYFILIKTENEKEIFKKIIYRR